MSTVIEILKFHRKIRSFLRIFCLLSLITTEANAQTIALSDTLKKCLHEKPQLTAKWDTHNSFITGRSIQIQSLKAGLVFHQKLSLGVGFHWVNSRNFQEYVLNGFKDSSPIRMRYWSVFGEFVFYQNKKWLGVIPVQIGIGKSFLKKGDDRIFENSVCLYEPSISMEYKFSPWVAIGAGYGYRIMLKNNRAIDQNFYAPIYVLRARILFDELYTRYILPLMVQRD